MDTDKLFGYAIPIVLCLIIGILGYAYVADHNTALSTINAYDKALVLCQNQTLKCPPNYICLNLNDLPQNWTTDVPCVFTNITRQNTTQTAICWEETQGGITATFCKT